MPCGWTNPTSPTRSARARTEPGTLRGPVAAPPAPVAPRELLAASAQGLLVRAALACLVAGFGLLNVLDPGWAHALGVLALVGFVVLGFLAALPRDLVRPSGGD